MVGIAEWGKSLTKRNGELEKHPVSTEGGKTNICHEELDHEACPEQDDHDNPQPERAAFGSNSPRFSFNHGYSPHFKFNASSGVGGDSRLKEPIDPDVESEGENSSNLTPGLLTSLGTNQASVSSIIMTQGFSRARTISGSETAQHESGPTNVQLPKARTLQQE